VGDPTTLDLISASLASGVLVLGGALILGVLPKALPYPKPLSRRGQWLVGMTFAIYCVGAIGDAWYDNVSIAASEYPGLAAAFANASEADRRKMCVVAQAGSHRREILSLSLAQRDGFLKAGGYCAFLATQECKPVPPGIEAQGMVINAFPSGEVGPSCGDFIRTGLRGPAPRR
jgi:hypothetical protein